MIVSTLQQLFLGRKDLFKGLWIEDKWDWTKINPVIHLSFDRISYKKNGLEVALQLEVEAIAKSHGIELSQDYPTTDFGQLIEKLAQKQGKVVIFGG